MDTVQNQESEVLENNITDLFISKYKELSEIESEEDLIKKFNKLLSTKRIFSKIFSAADVEGNLTAQLYYGYIFYMPNEELFGKVYPPKTKHRHLNKEIPVLIYDIDIKNKRVYVSRKRAKDKAQSEKRLDIIKRLENKESPIIEKAIIKFIDSGKKRVIIDIGNIGIMGVIPIEHWKQGYEYYLEKVAVRNRVVDIDIIKHMPRKNRSSSNIYVKNEHFICSRKNLMPDPWEGIEKKFPRETVVTFTCINKLDYKFFARIDGLDDIDLYVEYPNKERNIPILEGMKYQGYIYNVNEEKKIFKARVFKMLPEQVE